MIQEALVLRSASPLRLLPAAASTLLLTASAAAADRPAAIAWSTYLRAGPGETYAVLDELVHDRTVTVAGCDARWCQVSDGVVRGYVDRDALDLPRLQAPQPPSSGPCAIVSQADDRKPRATRFCSVKPTGS